MTLHLRLLALLPLLGLAACQAPAQSLTLQPIASGLQGALLVTAPPGDDTRLFVVLQGGSIRIIESGTLLPTPFLSVTAAAGNETGLLGLAFHPDYAENGYFYINYTPVLSGQLTTRISRFSVSAQNPNAADPQSEVVLLEYAQPFSNHNGGMMAFGPNDGYLYIASGDGGSGDDPQNNGQNRNTLLGKLLRINVDENPGETTDSGGPNYDIPADNPFVGVANTRPEIWAYGLRNPWRFSFDRQRGDLYIGDVGQNAREELHFQSFESNGGENYGWRVFEGTLCNIPPADQSECDALAPDAVVPFYDYPRTAGRSITGGYVYRGTAMPFLRGTYFFADFVTARVWTLRLLGGSNVTEFQEQTAQLEAGGQDLTSIASFGEDNAGELYIVSLAGTVWKIVPENGAAEGEGNPFTGLPHAADVDGDFALALTELLRVIQFFNAGGYCCAGDSSNGFQPAPCTGTGCAPHSADYISGGDFAVSLSELLRVIQIFNAGGYFPCAEAGTPDGYCPAV